jgi:hypothetical protein
VLDVVYDPWPTPLAAGCRGVVVSGAAMLLHQAAEQVRLMTGRPCAARAMRQALAGRCRCRRRTPDPALTAGAALKPCAGEAMGLQAQATAARAEESA